MNYGLYISATGVLTNMHRQDVLANNLANAQTVGFKQNLAAFNQRLPESQEDPAGFDLANDLLDKLGGGLTAHAALTDLSAGSLQNTGNALDLAIDGQGFFTIQNKLPDGSITTALTRDGRFTLSQDGQLLTTVGGHGVLDSSGQPIRVDPSVPLTVDETGRLSQNNQTVGQLQVATVDPQSPLNHLGQGMYEASANLQTNNFRGRIQQGFIEQSNVDSVREMVELIQTTRAVNDNATMIRYQDSLMDKAVNVLGRVA
ncbi:MAG: flagellar basal-body rod protein FlgF [Phycisphaeraceae bacterium]